MAQDMPWRDDITLQFELVNKFTTNESEYYGPYNTLLHVLFPSTDGYQVSLKYERKAGSINFTIVYITTRRKVLVFFVQVKSYLAYDNDSDREQADEQMRRKFLECRSASLPIPSTLYGLSALGTRLCIYEYTVETRTLTPPRIIPGDPELLTDTAPQERWNLELFEPQGEARLKRVVDRIKEMVVAGPECKCFALSLNLALTL